MRKIICCELLSNSYLRSLKNSEINLKALMLIVVNCFQIRIFVH